MPNAGKSSSSEVSGTRRSKDKLPDFIAPQLATLIADAPAGEDWLHEPKFDGYRLLGRIDRGHIKLLTRRGNDWTDRFPTIETAMATLPCQTALIDGEAVVFDKSGVTNFQRLQVAIGAEDPAISFMAFDLLYLDGHDLRDLPLVKRKRALESLLEGAPKSIRYSDHIAGNGPAFVEQACELGLEGIVSKNAGDCYREGRTKSWLKIKCLLRQEFVIVGFTDPSGSRHGFGSLLTGVRDHPDGPLRYTGRVGTGFSQQTLKNLFEKLQLLERDKSPIPGLTYREAGKGVHWVEPHLVAEVEFREWTDDGQVRHGSFKGLREDKDVTEVVEERLEQLHVQERERAVVKITNPDKILYPDTGVTKRQLAEYWERVAEYALPLIGFRPLTLNRCPDGISETCFYQKHVGSGMPDAVGRIQVDPDDEEPYAMVEDVQSLIGLTQMGVIELHVWGSTADHLEQPDILVFDLDPAEDLAWKRVVEAAFDVKQRLESLDLVPFVRLTGGKGLHVVVPVIPGPDWDAVEAFTRAFAQELAESNPNNYTASISKAKRVDKILIDYLRNNRGSTAIGSYSPRAKPGSPVALPVEWEELNSNWRKAPVVSVLEVQELVEQRDRDPWQDFEVSRRSLTN